MARYVSIVIFLFLSTSYVASAAKGRDLTTTQKVEILKNLAPYTEWKLKSVQSLSSPRGFDVPTGHPQSLVIEGDKMWLATKGSKFGAVFFYNIHREEGEIDRVYYHSTMRFKIDPGLVHAGGMTFDKDRTHLFTPVAANMFGGTSVIKFRKDGEPVGDKEYEEVARFPFHLGALLYDPTYDVMFAVGRDKGFNWALYGNSIYLMDFKTVRTFPYRYDGEPAPFYPVTKDSYQDCKSLGGEGYFICSAKHGYNFWNLGGTLDVVHFSPTGTFVSSETIHIPVGRARHDGTFTDEHGLYIPGYYGFPPLSYNGFDLEFSKDMKSVTLYFAPNDEPDTNLFIYEAKVQ